MPRDAVVSTFDEIQKLLDARTDPLFAGPRSDEEIATAEAALGTEFPPALRAYLRRWGLVTVPGLSLQYLGLFDTDEVDYARSPYPSVVSQTLRARSRGLPPRYVVVRDENGTQYVCLDMERRRPDGEWLVTRWDPVSRAIDFESEVDFAAFMLDELVERQELFG